MTAPGFRVLTEEEISKLSMSDYITYMRAFIDHIHEFTQDTQKSIDARNERLKNLE